MRESLENPLKTGHVICMLEGSAEEVIIKKTSKWVSFTFGTCY